MRGKRSASASFLAGVPGAGRAGFRNAIALDQFAASHIGAQKQFPGLDLRVALYLQHEAKLEALRRQRHSAAARAIAEHAVIQAQRDQKAGYDWDSSFDTLQQQHQAIISRL